MKYKTPTSTAQSRRRSRSPKTSQDASRYRRILVVIGLSLAIFGVFAAWWSIGRIGSPASRAELPQIETAGLDATATALIGQYLEKVRKAPRDGEAWGSLGAVLKSFGFRDEAGQCLTRAERLDPKQPRWPYLQATLRTDEPISLRIAKLRRATDLSGNEPEMPRLRLAQLLAEMGQEDAALEELRQLLHAKPACIPARLLTAHIHQARGQ